MLTQVDIIDAISVGRYSFDHGACGPVRNFAALCQRAEADGAGSARQRQHLFRERNIIPCDMFVDRVGRLAVAERHIDSAGRLIHRSNECTDTVTGGNCQQIASGIVIADSADSPAFDTVLRGMIGKIHGSSSGFAASRQNIPQKFADADNKGFRIHLNPLAELK